MHIFDPETAPAPAHAHVQTSFDHALAEQNPSFAAPRIFTDGSFVSAATYEMYATSVAKGLGQAAAAAAQINPWTLGEHAAAAFADIAADNAALAGDASFANNANSFFAPGAFNASFAAGGVQFIHPTFQWFDSSVLKPFVTDSNCPTVQSARI